ncbi:hypothetical protein BU23DRAFT_488829 [Bimuria novae-zelandiae CBS 107.79]|uniref:Rhodopsin domain-containing protein n=1 Tax=Bimuria novae-zelandiae CBS 107.79 TaxID=1447943 RepID=A0A6A5URW4_9PLEO|nr:hypothetical protein BU23DRAFT_488829 [Bimuria novae-zelandiae CBS 107.79]
MTVQPTGPGLTLLIVMSVCLALTTIVVALRIWARLTIKALGLDDWLMILGWVCLTFVFICDFIFINHGIGAHAYRISEDDKKIARKWFLFAGIGYAISTAPIKASICVLLLRITANTRALYTYILYSNIFLACVGTLVRVTAYAWRCRPFSAAWDPNAGKCADASILTNTSYFFGAICILTDCVCAVLPTVVVWHMRLERRIKWYIGIILALGFLASIATIIRMKYLINYGDPLDTLYNLVPIALWSEMECTLGILAGSLTTLRPFLRLLPRPFSSSLHRRPPSHALRDFYPNNRNMNTPSISIPGSHPTPLSTDSRTKLGPSRGKRDQREEITYMGHSFHIKGGKNGDEEEIDETGSMRMMLGMPEREPLEIVKETRYEVRSVRDWQERGWGDWRADA